MIILTSDEIRKVEEKENEIGSNYLHLMELAGAACSKKIRAAFAPGDGPVAVVCGKGKNGGDGFVIARKLRENDYDVTCIMAFGEPKAPEAAENWKRAADAGVPVVSYGPDRAFSEQTIASARVVVDCIFGIGFRGPASDEQTDLFDFLNRCAGTIVSVDVPSGVGTDSGAVWNTAVRADSTYAISTLKPAHVLYPSREYCGKTEVLEIGIKQASFDVVSPSCFTYSSAEIRDRIPTRPVTAHKNDFGHLLSVCGSRNMPGAACMCAQSAIRSGVGLVTAAFPKSAYPSLAAHTMEAMLLPLAETGRGELSAECLPELHEQMKKASAIVVGCGLGHDSDTAAVVENIIRTADCPVLLDADAINLAAEHPSMLKKSRVPLILTPHPGEMARLCGRTVPEIQADRQQIALEYAHEFGVTLLLKGPDTVVAPPSGDVVYLNMTGNQGLAKGGSGDTLSGVIGALIAQGMQPFDAAVCGAFLHGKAAEKAAETVSLRAMCASDLLAALPEVLKPFDV